MAKDKKVWKIADAVKSILGDDVKKKAALATYAAKVLKSDFQPNRYVREALESLAGK